MVQEKKGNPPEPSRKEEGTVCGMVEGEECSARAENEEHRPEGPT